MNRTQRIIDLHHQGFEPASIASQLGINPHAVEDVLREASLTGVTAGGAEAGPVVTTAIVRAPPPRPVGQRPPLTGLALLGGGFQRVGAWASGDGADKGESGGVLAFEGAAPGRPGLYAFVADGEAKYLGLTLRNLDGRLKLYGEGRQAGQVRMRTKLADALKDGPVEVYAVTPPDGVWSGWPVSTASGLEAAMLKRYDLPWNRKDGNRKSG